MAHLRISYPRSAKSVITFHSGLSKVSGGIELNDMVSFDFEYHRDFNKPFVFILAKKTVAKTEVVDADRTGLDNRHNFGGHGRNRNMQGQTHNVSTTSVNVLGYKLNPKEYLYPTVVQVDIIEETEYHILASIDFNSPSLCYTFRDMARSGEQLPDLALIEQNLIKSKEPKPSIPRVALEAMLNSGAIVRTIEYNGVVYEVA